MKNNNIKSMAVRAAIAFAIIVASASVASARKTSVDINGRESSGFNGLEHVLQKPLGNPSFPGDKRGFWNNMFLGASVGGSMINNDLSSSMRPGYKFGANIGGWFTPVHGFRLSGATGRHAVNKGMKNAWYGSIKAEYMLNLTSLLYGYNPDRTFELIGAAGPVIQVVRQDGFHSYNYGAAASLQMRFNLGPTFYLFMEPEINMLAGYKYNYTYGWERIYTNICFNVGMGYRILTGKYRTAGAEKFLTGFEDNMFMGGGAGLASFLTTDPGYKNPYANVFFGKMFTPISGAQISAQFFKKRVGYGFNDIGGASAALDYVLNLNNAFSGYRPDAFFQMLLNAGVNASKIQEVPKIHFGAQIGLTGLFRLCHQWGIYVHPQIAVHQTSYTNAFGLGRRPLLSVDFGLRYTVGDYTRLFRTTDAKFDDSTPWYVMLGGGTGLRLRFERDQTYNGFIGLGRQFNQLSGMRVIIDGEAFRYYYRRGTIGVDYLTSISTAMAGYNPTRLFDVEAFGGLLVGGSKFEGGTIHPTFGVRAGLKGTFRVTSTFGIFLEPQLYALYGPIDMYSSSLTPAIRAQLGFQYRFKM